MSVAAQNRPRLVVDHRVLLVLSDVAEPDLLAVFDPPSSGRDVRDGLILRTGSGPRLAARLTAAGYTEKRIRGALAASIAVARDAQNLLTASVRARLGWPAATEFLTADGWLEEYAASGPDPWLLDLAGGLSPAALLRCCLLARPAAQAELWLPVSGYAAPPTQRAKPAPAPVLVESARHLISLGKDAQSVEQTRQQP